jgi:hypothetical protein
MKTFLLVSLIGLSHQAHDSASWRSELKADSLAVTQGRRLTGANAPANTKEMLSEHEFMVRLTSARRAALRQSDQARLDRNIDSTLSPLISYLKSYPRDEGIRSYLFDLSYANRRFELAYDAVAPEVDWMSSLGSHFRASLITANRGKIYAGQSKFITSAVAHSMGAFSEEIEITYDGRSEIESVLLNSLLAIGLDEFRRGSEGADLTEFYMGAALVRDPGNVVASYALSQVYLRGGRKLEARYLLQRAAPLAKGKLKKHLELLLRQARDENTGSSLLSVGGGE